MLEVRNLSGDNSIKPKHSRMVPGVELPPWVDIVAFSSTKWEDAHERPRQLMTRCAKTHRVFFFQEPKFDACDDPYLELLTKEGVNLVIPHLCETDLNSERNKEKLIGLLLSLAEIHQYIFWYFSPLAIESTTHFNPRCIVYDCMNEPSWLRTTFSDVYESRKKQLTSRANHIFTTDLTMCLDASRLITNIHLFADASNPKTEDWDALWNEMSSLIRRSLNGLPPFEIVHRRI